MQNTVYGEEDFIRDIISPSAVNKTDETQAIPEFAHASPFFMIFFLTFPCRGVTTRLQPHDSSPTFDKVSELE